MTARWDRLPANAKVTGPRKRRARAPDQTWRCAGVGGCGKLLTGSYQSAERHVTNEHRAARLDCVSALRLRDDNRPEPG